MNKATLSMKHLAAIQNEFFKMAISDKSSSHKKPSFFTATKYRDPTDKELQEIHDSNPNADDLIQGFGYSIIGRGFAAFKHKLMIINAIERLNKLDPGNQQYKIALKRAKSMKLHGQL